MIDLNNREIAILIWFAPLMLWCLREARLRENISQILRILQGPKVAIVLGTMTLYVVMCVALLSHLNIWHWSNLKTTAIWGVTFAFATMVEISRITEDDMFYRKTAREILGVTAALLFVTEFYTFSLPIEIGLVPVLVILGSMHAMSQAQNDSSQVATPVEWLLTLMVIGMLGYAAYRISQDWHGFININTAREFLVPVMLSILFLPFVFLMSVVVVYENVFLRLAFRIKDERLRRFAKLRGALAFGWNLDSLRRWSRELMIHNVVDRESIRNAIRHVQAVKRREANPPTVSASEGWSPYVAMRFLEDVGLLTGDYHRSFDEWFAESPLKQVGNGLLSDHVKYIVEGSEIVAKRLKLTLDAFDVASSQASNQEFLAIVHSLVRKATGHELNDNLLARDDAEIELDNGKRIVLNRQDWGGGVQSAYSRTLSIESVEDES